VIGGELFHTSANSTHGWISIRGWEQPIRFELLGAPSAELHGKHLRFQASGEIFGGCEPKEGSDLQIDERQIGVTGQMTIDDQVRVFTGSVENFAHRSKLGEPPPCFWKRRLYLEWFGNSGRVVIELVDPSVIFVERIEGEEIELPVEPLPEPPFDPNHPPESRPPTEAEIQSTENEGESAAETPEDASFDLIDPELAAEISASLPELELSKDMDQHELLDDLIERGSGIELGEIIGATPDWDTLSEQQAETRLKAIVAGMALYRVAYHVCEHCSMRDAYRILIERLAKESTIFPELGQTDWVTHFSTSDFCKECENEFDLE